MLLQGKKLFENNKKAENLMNEERANFHNLSVGEQEKLMNQLSAE